MPWDGEAMEAAITEACEVLRSAIADLTSAIVDLEGLAEGVDVAPASLDGQQGPSTP